MNILFIYPTALTYGPRRFRSSILGKILLKFLSPPFLDFQALSSVTPKKHSFNFISEDQQKINFEENYDLVGITLGTQNAIRGYEIADEFRKRGMKVVLGGWHPSVLPQEAKQHADTIVIGEAEDLWPQLIKDLENNKLKPFYRQTKPVDLSKIPPIKIKEAKKDGFFNYIQATRGCPNRCPYCSITNTEHFRIYRTRPVDHVIGEIKEMPQKQFRFGDSSLTINTEYTKQLFREMKGLNKRFSCCGNINTLNKDDEILKLASEAGCIAWLCGFESINQKNLDEFCTKSKRSKEYSKTIRKIQDYGLEIYGSFMFGFDNDTINVFNDTFNEITSWDLNLANFFILTPYPGTPLFAKIQNEGRFLTQNWSKYDLYHVVFQPKNMTPEELRDGTLNLYKDFYSTEKAIKRIIRSFKIGFYPFIFTTNLNYYISRRVKTFEY